MGRDKGQSTASSQIDRFREAARELGCDESEERFVEVVKKLAKAPPAKNEPKPKPRQPKGSSPTG